MSATYTISTGIAWHGRLMVLAWTVLVPLGIVMARYFKVTRRQDWPRRLDNQLWWQSHLALQMAGLACMSAALAIVWREIGSAGFGSSWHATLGWLVLVLGWLQLVGGLLRGSKGSPLQAGDHYDMTRRRVVFEWLHKVIGYGAVLISVLVTGLGLQLVNAPRWMYLTIAVWWVVVLGVAIKWQRAGRCIDTYQAIWGPDPEHPGNRRRVIGWGIKRYPGGFGK
jgi:hypothetical protein